MNKTRPFTPPRWIAWLGALAAAQAALADCTACALEVGLAPPGLAAAGVSPEDAGDILGRIHDAAGLRMSLALAADEMDAVTASLSDAMAEFYSDPLNAQTVAAYEASLAQHESVESQLANLRTQLFAAAVDGLPAAVTTRLIAWRAASARRVPNEFRVLERSEEEWKAIEVALRAEERSLQTGEPPATHHVELLQNVRSEPAVIEAALWLDLHLEAIGAIFAGHAH